MNKLFFPLAFFIVFTFSSCAKNTTPTPTPKPPSTFPDDKVLGNYTGTIITKIDLMYADSKPAYSETNSNTETASITNDASTYLINGQMMDGGPSIYTISSGYVLNTKTLTIDFSKSYSGFTTRKNSNGVSVDYKYVSFASGQLRHQ